MFARTGGQLVVGVGFIVLGGLAQDGISLSAITSEDPAGGTQQFTLDQRLKEIIPLAINIVITGLTESLGLIHATSLKWALFYEDRIEFNANPRLLSFSRQSWANPRLTNAIYPLALAMCYASSSGIEITIPNLACYSTRNYEETEYTGPGLYSVSRSGPLMLRLSLLVLSAICI